MVTHKLNHIPILKVNYFYLLNNSFLIFLLFCSTIFLQGDFMSLPPKVQRFIAEKAELMNPRAIFICDGSQREAQELIDKCVERGVLSPLKAYENWLALSAHICNFLLLLVLLFYFIFLLAELLLESKEEN